ncbi:PPE domain-containing protein [Pseudonocardia lacus]|uniref:PPE domain-containing protein n=1 Tax=Pseudonocardia lacus TaxID=2835865 RepID=UPI001BDC1BBE|nr:hypothetical protein [Pseudonocardia lacus]
MDDIRWRGLTHQEIYDQVWSGPGHVASADAQGMWVDVRNQLIDIDNDLRAATRGLGEGWEGTTAAEAARNLSLLGSWVTQAVESAVKTGAALDTQAEYVAAMRRNLPPPAEGSPIAEAAESEIYVLGVPPSTLQDWHAQDAQRAELANQAVQVMETYTSNSARNKPHIHPFATPITVTAAPTDGGGFLPPINTGAAAPSIPVGAGGAGGGVGPGAAGGFPVPVTPGPLVPGGGPAGRGPGGSTVPGSGVPGPGAPGRAPIPGTVPGPGRTGPGQGVPGRPGGGFPPGDPIIRGPAGAPTGSVPGGGRIPGAPIPGSTIPGGIPGSAIPGTGGPGSAVPGTGSPGAGGPGTAAAGSGTQAASTRSPGYIPGAGFGAGVGAQSREHRRPSYLVDDSGAFADDRWFTAPVITPFDVLPRR